MPKHKRIARKKKPSGGERIDFYTKNGSPPAGRAAASLENRF
jgi:hypothetical protein